MTQKSIAKECADWIRRKAVFKSNITGENMQGFMTVESSTEQVAYMPMTGFTTVDIGCERGNNSYNMTNRMEAPFSTQYMQLFEKIWNDRSKMQDVTDVVIENISSAYNENSPEFIYFMTLYHVFSEFWRIFRKMFFPTNLQDSKKARSGTYFTISRKMLFSQSSTNLKNTMAVFWRIVLVLEKLSQP